MFPINQRVRIRKGVTPYPGKLGTVVEVYEPVAHLGSVTYEVKLDRAFSVPHTKLYKADELEPVKS